jgi:hypothetical protein
MYLVIGFLLLLFGSLMLGYANAINDLEIRYDDQCSGSTSCTITFTPSTTMKSPNLYYRVSNFYANHRNFVKSIDYAQLRADSTDAGSDCSPVTDNKDISTPLLALDGSTLSPDEDVNPCGLRAKYLFTDSFTLAKTAGGAITIDQTKISHSVDRNSRFQNPNNFMSIQWHEAEDEHLMVWYQTDAFPDFIKLWGRIDVDLEKDVSYTLTISNTWDQTQFESNKYVYFSETNFFGGNNIVFGVFYIVGGCIFIILAIVMVFLEIFIGRKRDRVLNKVVVPQPPNQDRS